MEIKSSGFSFMNSTSSSPLRVLVFYTCYIAVSHKQILETPGNEWLRDSVTQDRSPRTCSSNSEWHSSCTLVCTIGFFWSFSKRENISKSISEILKNPSLREIRSITCYEWYRMLGRSGFDVYKENMKRSRIGRYSRERKEDKNSEFPSKHREYELTIRILRFKFLSWSGFW